MKIKPTNIRFAKTELDELRARAAASGKPLSAFIRSAALTHCKVGLPDDTLAVQIKRDVNDLHELYDFMDRQLRELLMLTREILSKTDPQAVARIAEACKRPNHY